MVSSLGGGFVGKKYAMTIRLPGDLADKLRELSYLTHTPINQIITQVLEGNIPELLERARKEK